MSLVKEKYKNRWSLFEGILLGFSLIWTKIFYPKAKLICYPIYMRGKKSMVYGAGLNVGYGCRFDLINTEKVTLQIGENFELGDYCHIVAVDRVKIGNNVMVASKVFISDCNHGSYSCSEGGSEPSEPPRYRALSSSPVIIGNNVWIGDNAVILAGVHIGDGCVIGANSVVNHDIETNTIAVGVPARVVKRYNLEKKCWVKV